MSDDSLLCPVCDHAGMEEPYADGTARACLHCGVGLEARAEEICGDGEGDEPPGSVYIAHLLGYPALTRAPSLHCPVCDHATIAQCGQLDDGTRIWRECLDMQCPGCGTLLTTELAWVSDDGPAHVRLTVAAPPTA